MEILVREPEDDYSRRLKSLVSNIQREAISPLEVAETLQRLLTEGESARTQQDLAQLLGMRKSWVSDMLRILTLPAKLQEQLRTSQKAVTYDTVISIARADDPAFQSELITAALAGEGNPQIRRRLAAHQTDKPRRAGARRAVQTFTKSCDGYTATVKGPDKPDARAKMREAVSALLQSLN